MNDAAGSTVPRDDRAAAAARADDVSPRCCISHNGAAGAPQVLGGLLGELTRESLRLLAVTTHFCHHLFLGAIASLRTLNTAIAISLSSSLAHGASTRVARTDSPISDSPRFVLTAFSHAQAKRSHQRARSSASCFCARSLLELWNAMEEAMPAPTTARLPPKPAEVKNVPHQVPSAWSGGMNRATTNAVTVAAAVTHHHHHRGCRGEGAEELAVVAAGGWVSVTSEVWQDRPGDWSHLSSKGALTGARRASITCPGLGSRVLRYGLRHSVAAFWRLPPTARESASVRRLVRSPGDVVRADPGVWG